MNRIDREMEHIQNEWRILDNQWKTTCNQWNDSMRHQFQNEFWREFETMVPAYLRKLQETSDLISKAYRDLDL